MSFKSDHIGIILSCSCIVHCIALPFILLGMGLTGGDTLFHTIFLALAVLVTAHAIYHSYKKHCKHIVLFFGAIGIAFLAADFFVPHHDGHIEIMPIMGSLFLIITHGINLYLDKRSATKPTTLCNVCKDDSHIIS